MAAGTEGHAGHASEVQPNYIGQMKLIAEHHPEKDIRKCALIQMAWHYAHDPLEPYDAECDRQYHWAVSHLQWLEGART